MTYRYIRLERLGAVARVVMDNPATMNAMDQDLGPELVAALEGLARDRRARAVVLTGAGGNFSGGGNIRRAWEHLEGHPGRGAGEVFEQYTKWVTRVIEALTGMPQPVISAVEGAASGAGLAWMLASDLVFAAADARIVPGFVHIGLVPAAGVTWHLPRLLGLPRAAELLLLGRPIPPERALHFGLVDRLIPAAELQEAALEAARGLAEGPAEALAAGKRLLGGAARGGLSGQLEDERRAVMDAADLAEFRQRVGRFFNR